MKWLLPLFVCTALVGCHRTTATVRSVGMEPTIKIGDEVRLDQSYYSNKSPQRFDVIAVRAPLVRETDHTEVVLLKKVIALGDETVELKHGVIFINGNKLEESYSPILANQDFGPVTIPSGEYFLLGDNRPESWDSRFWKPGTIKKTDIVAKVADVIHK